MRQAAVIVRLQLRRKVALACCAVGGLLVIVNPASAFRGEGSPGVLLIVHAPELAVVAQQWRDYRSADGWAAETLEARPTESPEALRERVIRALPAELVAGRPMALLLLGDSDTVPCFRRVQSEPTIVDQRDEMFATDAPYAELAHGRDPMRVGRVPARSAAEATAVLTKLQTREAALAAQWQSRIEIVAGEGRFGEHDRLLETLTTGLLSNAVGPEYSIRASYCRHGSPWCPVPSEVSTVVREQLRGPALLFAYLGHGNAQALDKLNAGPVSTRILKSADLADLARPATSGQSVGVGVAILICCSAGWFDRADGTPCLAESMLLAEQGPLAVIAGSRPTHPYANAVVAREALTAVCEQRVGTVGELEAVIERVLKYPADADIIDALAAPIAIVQKWKTRLPQLRGMHAELYNLLGDPCTRLPHPPAANSVQELTVEGDHIRGWVPALEQGSVIIELERARTDTAGLAPTNALLGEALDAACRTNWPLANDPVIGRIQTSLVNGRFDVQCDPALLLRARSLRVLVFSDAQEARLRALGGLAIPVVPASTTPPASAAPR